MRPEIVHQSIKDLKTFDPASLPLEQSAAVCVESAKSA
jgi:hypothetical protein